jgi:tripartite-type tricarboxylate transporter receptor subunit TctC
MMSNKLAFLAAASAISAAAIVAPCTATAANENFYKNKTVSLVVGFSPGGGYDSYGRLLANHMGRHVPGNPKFIVRNMPGASSLKSVKYLDLAARKDARVLTLFNPGVIMKSLTDPKKVKVDFTKIRFVGSITADVRVCYFWHTTGIRNLEEFFKRDPVIMGATAIGATAFINASLLRTLFGAKVKHVTGYPGSAEQRIALERGELEGMCGSWTSIPAAWVRDKKIIPIVRYSKITIAGMPPMPNIMDMAKTKEKRQILKVLLASDEFGRPVAMGPEVPESLLKIMRTAFNATVKDKAFLADADKQKRTIIGPMAGQDVEAVVRELYATPKTVVAKLKDAISPGGSVEKVKLSYVTVKGKVTKSKKGNRQIWIDVNGKNVKTKISGSRTKIMVDGKKVKRKAIKTGMICQLTYLGPGSESKQVDCTS